MSRHSYTIIAFVLALAATYAGWVLALSHKIVPRVQLAFWFPTIVITNPRGLDSVALSLIQFPLLATAFALGIRRWPVGRVATVLAVVYALLVQIALAIVISH